MDHRVLQQRRYEIDRKRLEAHEKLLGDIKVIVCKSEEVVVFLKNQYTHVIREGQKATTWEGEDRKDLGIACNSSTQSKTASKGARRKTGNRRQQNLIFRLQAPSWSAFGTRCLDVYVRRSLFESNIKILKYRVVSYYAPMMEHARKGNIAGIQEMFRMGTASPNDRDTNGHTVLGGRRSAYLYV
jgi:hypothetical protein